MPKNKDDYFLLSWYIRIAITNPTAEIIKDNSSYVLILSPPFSVSVDG